MFKKTWIKWTVRILLLLFVLAAAGVLIGAVAYRVVDRSNGKIGSSGEERAYLLHVPIHYTPSKPTPLVITLHGFAQWPAHQMQLTHWNDLADQHGFIVVYPSGAGFPKRWRSGHSGTNLDVTFLSDLIDKLEREYNIDPARIYANGLSMGGGMTVLLACNLSGRIAAIGAVAGAFPLAWSECHPKRPVPAILFHGTADPIVPYRGGNSSDLPASFPEIAAWTKELARRNGCKGPAMAIPAVGAVDGVQYGNCDLNAEVRFYKIMGGGHTWPGGDPMPKFIVGHTTRDIDATKTMWEFFQQHPMPEQ